MQKYTHYIDNCILSEDAGKLILRLTIGFFLLLHGIGKLTHPQIFAFVEHSFTSIGLPAFLAYLVYVGEIVAPIMIIIGWRVRLAALLVIIDLLVAILLARFGAIFTATQGGSAALEVEYLFLFGAIAIRALGAGKYRLMK